MELKPRSVPIDDLQHLQGAAGIAFAFPELGDLSPKYQLFIILRIYH
jgi:hypothetical protein